MRKNGQPLGAERVGCGPEPLSLAVEQSDVGPLGGEAGGGGIPETLCGAGHESRLAGEWKRRVHPLPYSRRPWLLTRARGCVA
jgi:hypothetical protein